MADEEKGTDRLYRPTEAKMLENIQTLLKLCALFPKWVTMIDHSEPTQCLISNLDLRENKEKGKSCASKTVRSYGNNIEQTIMHKQSMCKA